MSTTDFDIIDRLFLSLGSPVVVERNFPFAVMENPRYEPITEGLEDAPFHIDRFYLETLEPGSYFAFLETSVLSHCDEVWTGVIIKHLDNTSIVEIEGEEIEVRHNFWVINLDDFYELCKIFTFDVKSAYEVKHGYWGDLDD